MIPALLQFAELHAGYRSGRFTPAEVAAEVLARAEGYGDPAVWICRVPEAAVRERAAALAAEPGAIDRLPLYGIPFAVKDNIDVAGLETTAGCPAFAYRPGCGATVVERLLAAGAILIGKANLDQFATGLVGTRSPYGAPRSVFDPRFISGGSSSGSGVAVAAGLVSFALGTDTAGSGRVPAAFNNIVGLKPTRGLLSAAGVVPACRSLDCVSVFAAGAGDAWRVTEIARGFDPADPYSRTGRPVVLPLEGYRFGVLAPADREFYGDDGAAALYDAAIEQMAALGGTAVAFDYAPFRDAAALLYGGPWVAERLAALGPFYAAQREAMDPTVRAVIGGAVGKSAVEAFEGQYRLQALSQAAARQWRGLDLLLLPTTPTTYRVDEIAADPVGLNSRLGLYTNFVNLLDYAAIAVPAGFRADGLPFGVTLVGPAFADHDLAILGDRLHRALGSGAGRTRAALAAAPLGPSMPADGCLAIAVAGAHLSGMPLNHQLLELGATLLRRTRTAPGYRLFALAGTVPAKPGLVREPGFAGPGIEIELWSLAPEAFGRFVAQIPAPMAIGKLALADGGEVPGFLCEPAALAGARDITEWRGWRRYVERDGERPG